MDIMQALRDLLASFDETGQYLSESERWARESGYSAPSSGWKNIPMGMSNPFRAFAALSDPAITYLNTPIGELRRARQGQPQMVPSHGAGTAGDEGGLSVDDFIKSVKDRTAQSPQAGNINAPGSENYIRWSNPDTQAPGSQRAAEIMGRLANSGDRPSDIMARQMFEEDKRKKYIMDLLTSRNPGAREQGMQMLQAQQAMYETERQPAVDKFKQMIEQLQQQTEATKAQADLGKSQAEMAKAEATASKPLVEIQAKMQLAQQLAEMMVPQDATDDQRMKILMGIIAGLFNVYPDMMSE